MIPASEQAIIAPVSFLSTTMARTPRAWDATRRSTKTVTTDATVTFVALCWRESAYVFSSSPLDVFVPSSFSLLNLPSLSHFFSVYQPQ
jgi:hypothetical protein